jgi:hypothetical protein
MSVTRTVADPFPHNGGGVNSEVGPIDRSSLPFALCFSDLGLRFDDFVFVDSRSILLFDTFLTLSTHWTRLLILLIELPDLLGVDRVGKHYE